MVAADHLQVPRQHGLFQHHGIDLGDGTIAHYLEGREIIRSSLDDFCNGESYLVIMHTKCSNKGVTLRRAMSRIGERKYNLLFNNCEHFANWCKTGRHRSKQMENFIATTNIGRKAIQELLPKTIQKSLHLLISEGLNDKASLQKAKELLKMVRKVKYNLIVKLEILLEKVNNEYQSTSNLIQIKDKNILIQLGQKLEDDLASLEELEKKMFDLMQHNSNKSRNLL